MTRLARIHHHGLVGPSPNFCHGKIILKALIALPLIAVGAGLVVPRLPRKQQALTASQEVGPSRMEGNLYTNDFLRLSIRVPEGWRAETGERLRQLVRESSELAREYMALILAAFARRSAAREEFNMPVRWRLEGGGWAPCRTSRPSKTSWSAQ